MEPAEFSAGFFMYHDKHFLLLSHHPEFACGGSILVVVLDICRIFKQYSGMHLCFVVFQKPVRCSIVSPGFETTPYI